MADFLPHELIIEILLKLPVKALVQFTSVCKSWNSIIKNPSFITTHVNRTTHSNNTATGLLLLLFLSSFSEKSDKKVRYVLHRDNETLDEYAELEFPFQRGPNQYLGIVGSCNGLLCLSNDCISCNPSIRKYVSLPRPRIISMMRGRYISAVGFGFDAKSNDYKVVRLVYLAGEPDVIVPPMVELYSLRLGSWRTINASAVQCVASEMQFSHPFINGAVHWLASGCKYRVKSISILLFHMGNEEFSNMELPSILVGKCLTDMSISVFGESLSVFDYDKSHRQFCSIWVLKEYGVAESWSKLITIDLRDGLYTAVGLRNNGEVLMATRDEEMVSLHPETQRVQDLGIRITVLPIYVDRYIESLVLLDKKDEVLRGKAESCGVVTHKGAAILIGDEGNTNGELWKKSKKRNNRNDV